MHSRTVSQPEIEAIIRKCQFCYIGMVDQQGLPYVLPFNFGYEDGFLYFHSAPDGKKIDILKNNPEVCVAFSADCELRFVNEEVACSYGMKYKSVLAYGKIEFVTDTDSRIKVLDVIMRTYSPREFKYSPPSLRTICCWKMKVDRFEGRVLGY